MAIVVVSYNVPWDLRRRGAHDAARHDVRIKDAIKKNLKEILGEESIVTSDGTKTLRIPLRYLEQYRFIYGNNQQQGIGQGEGTVGDVLYEPGKQGQGTQPGTEPGDHTYDVEVDLDVVMEIMMEDLALPWLEPRPPVRQIVTDDYVFTDLRKKGAWANFDKRRSLRENLLRNAARGDPGVHDLHEHDLRFRTWDRTEHPITQAVVYLLMDWSGSMTEDRKYLAKAMSFWVTRFVRYKYRQIALVFITHDTRANLVSEHDFFHKVEGGGTLCSSAYQLALDHIPIYHPPAIWNSYVLHFSDGDNVSTDNVVCRELILRLLEQCQAVGYVEILVGASDYAGTSSLLATLKAVTHPHFSTAVLRRREDIGGALQAFFRQQAA